MKILAPFSRETEVLPLIEAGASELYCGIVNTAWEKRFTFTGSVNLRHDKLANLASFQQLRRSVKAAERHNVPLFVAFNAHFYSPKQLPLVLKQAGKAVSAGADSLIIADPVLVQKVRQKFPEQKISLSTGQPCFNGKALSFFKQLGVERVVLPRHLTESEAKHLAGEAKKTGLETEAFVLNSICPFIDGLCSFQHIVEPSQSLPVQPLACRASYTVSAFGSGRAKDVSAAHVKTGLNASSNDCGLCAVHGFLKAGITSLKVAGRANTLGKKLADTTAVAEAISDAKKLSQKEFKRRAESLYFGLFHKTCEPANCYYPLSGRWGNGE